MTGYATFEPSFVGLRDVTVSLQPGKLVAVVGGVGAGKTALLLSLLGELHKVQGRVRMPPTVAITTQTAWLRIGTVRQNIVFGQPFAEERYRRVVFACALQRDLEQLPGGDEYTVIEDGANLSGGQRQVGG